MSNVILTSGELNKGKTADPANKIIGAFIQPLQFIPRAEKTPDWYKLNADFLEYQGIRQIEHMAPHFSKNLNLANGILDYSDYIPEQAPIENRNIFAALQYNAPEAGAGSLEFYPMIPTFINTLCNEYSKRNTRNTWRAIDEFSTNEMLDQKEEEIRKVLLQEASLKMTMKLIGSGHDPDDPEDEQLFQEELNPEKLKTLPEIQKHFTQNYRSMLEEWAVHQEAVDIDRFYMNELELRNFRMSLCTDRAWFHFVMKEDDYDIEIWNPMFTYVQKSPEARYASQYYAIGNIQLMTIADVLDKCGMFMNEDQIKSLQMLHPQTNAAYSITGYSPDNYYDNTKSKEWNTEVPPSLGMRQLTSAVDTVNTNMDMVSKLITNSAYFGPNESYMVRVSVNYWKGQRRVGHLTKVKENGDVIVDVIDESYIVTDEPVYDTTLFSNKDAMTLQFGEHIEWTWINESNGVVKIGPNVPTYYNMPQAQNRAGFSPMYLGVGKNNPGPLRYQFKGDNSLYGCKLPVEGAIFSDYAAKSNCPVDILKPYQIGYNIANNQIKDMIIDEQGVILSLDPNQLPTTSMGEDWGKHNYAKAYTVMKNFNILPLDRSLANTEGSASSGAPVNMFDLSQTQRILGRINLAQYYKTEGLSTLGITPQRLGQQTGRQTATGVEENMNASYNQTETYFTQFSDQLMPRVHQMRTDLAMYYHSTKPSVRLSYESSAGEKVFFQIDGTDFLLRDLNINPVSDNRSRAVIEEVRKKLLVDNTQGTIYELGDLLTSDSLGEMKRIFTTIKQEAIAAKQREHDQAMELDKQKQEAAQKEQQIMMDYQAMQAEANRRNQIIVAEIRAAGYGAGVDKNANMQNDYLDALDRIQASAEYNQQMGFEQQKESNRNSLQRDKLLLEDKKSNTQLQVAQIGLAVARENTTSSELAAKKKADKKVKEAKKK